METTKISYSTPSMEFLPPTPPPSPPHEWQLKAYAKTRETMSKIPQEWILTAPEIVAARQQLQSLGGNTVVEAYLTEDEVEITDLESVQLQDRISEGKLSALQVTSAFCKRAAIVGQIVSLTFVCVLCTICFLGWQIVGKRGNGSHEWGKC